MDGEADGGGDGNHIPHHRNEEAISAVAEDVGFLDVEEEEEDYEDLYNDVNVGEGFLQSMNKRNEAQHVEEKLGLQSDNNVPDTDDKGVIDGSTAEDTSAGVDASQGEVGSTDRLNEYEGEGRFKSGTSGIRVELGHTPTKLDSAEEKPNDSNLYAVPGNAVYQTQPNSNMGDKNPSGPPNANMGNGTTLFVGDLHWWTTDAELEAELCKYGQVKEVKFFDEKASGKSKGYCQVEFNDPSSAAACKEGMNGQVFNGRPCVVAFASPYSVKRMGEAQVSRNQQTAQVARRGGTDAKPDSLNGAGNGVPGGTITTGGNYQGMDGASNRGYGRGNWRGNGQGAGNRGAMGPMRNRNMGRGLMGMPFGGPMMGQGFDPAFGGPMGRMAPYGAFPGAPGPPFTGMMPSFPPVGGFPGVAPHVNPAFFGRGLPMNNMGMMPGGVDGANMGMWADPSMSSWGGEDNGGGRIGESSYGEEDASEYQFGEGNVNYAAKEKERDWSGSSDRKYRDDRDREKDHERDANTERERERERSRDRDKDRERDRYRDRYGSHGRYKDRENEHDDEWERGRSSKSHSKSRMSQDDHYRSRSRDGDYGKRRRLASD